MKTKSLLLSFLFTLCSVSILSAQGKKVDKALQGFLGTDFMVKFNEMSQEAEKTIQTFMLNKHKYAPEDVQRVQSAYDQTAQRFNQVLIDIKKDFMDKKKMKYISKYPDSYSKGLELELYKLNDYYAQNFQQVISDVTGEEIDGAGILIILAEVFSLTKGVVGYFSNLKQQRKYMTDSYLQENMIEPNRFPKWNEIDGTQGVEPFPKEAPAEEATEEEEEEEEDW